ncbi:MAG: phosphate ABC transporter permease subunit PstC [Candidatus Polarisedimenticolaceae bacterium]|nr:phosphate ABC transporter permease subunit PstC [Candidatus Polarisedimenticolaceae bacterium]
MQSTTLILILLAVMAVAFQLGRRRAFNLPGLSSIRELHSLPIYHGFYAAIWCGIPALLALALWSSFQTPIISQLLMNNLPATLTAGLSEAELGLLLNDIRNLAAGNITSGDISDELVTAADHYNHLQQVGFSSQTGVVFILTLLGATLGWRFISPELRARNKVERLLRWLLLISSTIAILCTAGIIFSVLFESVRFFEMIPLTDFIFGLQWSPQIAIRADQVGSSGAFGAIPLFTGTLLISLIAMLVAVPIGLMAAIYLSEYASPQLRTYAKPLLEILAGIPTVVYGFFAALTVAPMIRNSAAQFGVDASSESALAAGLVMGVMLIPFISSLSDDVINAVPQAMRDASYGLGATRSETILQVVIPAALPGIVGSILLAASRAIGETMIVVMAAGLSANLTANPLDSVTTVTVQIVTLLVGDQEFDSPKTLAAFALGLLLFLITLVLNVVALRVVRKYREAYE